MVSRLHRLNIICSCLSIVLVRLRSVSCQFISDRDTVTDLSYDVCENSLFWPGVGKANGFKNTITWRGMNDASLGVPAGSFYYEMNSVCFPEHIATHMDAPAHFWKGSWRVGQIPLDRMQGKAVVLEVGPEVLSDRGVVKDVDYYSKHPRAVTVDHIHGWENRHGVIEPDSIVLVNTGWGSRYLDWNSFYWANASSSGDDLTKLDFPGISPLAATFLVQERYIKMIGIDSGSIDVAQTRDFAVHQIFGERNVPILEMVANLDKLPAKGVYVIVLPLKLCEGSGAPARVISYHSAASATVFGNALTAIVVVFRYLSG